MIQQLQGVGVADQGLCLLQSQWLREAGACSEARHYSFLT